MVTSPNWGILDGSVDIVGQYLLIAVDSAIDSQELNVIFKSVEILGESLDLCVVRIIGTLRACKHSPSTTATELERHSCYLTGARLSSRTYA